MYLSDSRRKPIFFYLFQWVFSRTIVSYFQPRPQGLLGDCGEDPGDEVAGILITCLVPRGPYLVSRPDHEAPRSRLPTKYNGAWIRGSVTTVSQHVAGVVSTFLVVEEERRVPFRTDTIQWRKKCIFYHTFHFIRLIEYSLYMLCEYSFSLKKWKYLHCKI